MQPKLKMLNVRVPVELIHNLKVRAAERDTTVQALVTAALTKTLGASRG